MNDLTKVISDTQNRTPEELQVLYEGFILPARMCKLETLHSLQSLETRKEDILLIAYPKCGFNWTVQLLNDMAAAVKGEENTMRGPHQILEFGPPQKFQDYEEQKDPRVFGTHLTCNLIPKSFFENQNKLILVFRNPKDTAVSYYHFHQTNPGLVNYKSWNDFFPKFMAGEVCWGSFFDYAVEWEKHIDDKNLLVVTYEELKQNLCEGVKGLASFLGLSLNEEQIQSITKRGDFQAMKSKSEEKNPSIANIFYRKGEVGDWKNYFTETQNQEMDAMFEKYLAGTKLGKKLQYNAYCK